MASPTGAPTEPQEDLRKTQGSTEPTQEPTGKSPETKGDSVETEDKLVEAAKQREEVLQDYLTTLSQALRHGELRQLETSWRRGTSTQL